MRRCWSDGVSGVGFSVVFRSVPFVVRLVLARVGLLLASGDRRHAEILALRHQVLVLQRQVPCPTFALSGGWAASETLRTPETTPPRTVRSVSSNPLPEPWRIGLRPGFSPCAVVAPLVVVKVRPASVVGNAFLLVRELRT